MYNVDLSDLNVVLSYLYIYLSLIHLLENESEQEDHAIILSLLKQEFHGHIAQLRKQFNSINIYDYHNVN